MRYSHFIDETRRAFRCAKWFSVLSAVLMGIFGILLLIWPGTSMSLICTLLGALLLLFGVSRLISYFSNVSYHIAFQFDLALGLFSLLIGILLLTHPGSVLSVIWVLIGIYESVESVFKIQAAIDARHYQLSGWLLLLLSAVVYLLFGIFLIFNPAKGGQLFIRIAGISLLLGAAENLIFTLYTSSRLGKIRRQLHQEWLNDDILDPEDIID